MKSNHAQLESRGFVEDGVFETYKGLEKRELEHLLNSNLATDRTIAAKLLGGIQEEDVLNLLIAKLITEKKLYTKIMLSDSISAFGEPACEILLPYLGKVGSNQHTDLPDKPFLKQSYPLPRDIIARTICRIGSTALPSLYACLSKGNREQTLEALDAIGFIVYYSEEVAGYREIEKQFEIWKEDAVVTWKLLRTLQAFPLEAAILILNQYRESDVLAHRNEALRSIMQIQKRRQKKTTETKKSITAT